ncbi:hypothetical protein M9Y10_008130 [Tritrichomonas musculus]|uniref:F5/8 type C domain-containing protein n=1 Tax=Tritrichomonas musculus TaxID=1915356 RepID=A0ABR2IXE0_9EUKA
MEKEEIIRNQDMFPFTHYFVYKGKKYPLKSAYFYLSSEFFQTNRQELERTENIDINEMDDINIRDEDINTFICYVQQEDTKLNNGNVIALEQLSRKYGIKSLEEHATRFIQRHQAELVIKILHQHQHDSNFDSRTYEGIIGSNFDKYIDDEELFELDFPIIYRLLKIDQGRFKTHDKNRRIDFYMKCLDKYGKVASILFEGLETENAMNDGIDKCIDLLMTKYYDIFDFQFIGKSIIQRIYSRNRALVDQNNSQQELIKTQEKRIRELEKTNISLSEDKARIIFSKEKELETQRTRYETLLEEQQKANERKINKEHEKNEEERAKLIENIKILQDEINKLKPLEIAETDLGGNGIIHYLDDIASKSQDNHIIRVFNSIMYNRSNYNSNFNDWLAKSEYYSINNGCKNYICFDFINREIEISSYSIKSSEYRKDCTHIKNWCIEISNDGQNWETIDSHSNYNGLNGPHIVQTFQVKPNHFSRYCRLCSTGDFFGEGNWRLEIDHIEFYGRIKTFPH